MKKVQAIIDAIRAAHVPDYRSGIFDVELQQRGDAWVLVGETTDTDAADRLAREAREVGRATIIDEIVRLPDPALGPAVHGLVRAAVAPVYLDPALPAAQISQLVLGMRFDLLARRGDWLRVRGEDGYLGWVHQGYVQLGERAWAETWERGSNGEPVVWVGGVVVVLEGKALARVAWGGGGGGRARTAAVGRTRRAHGRRLHAAGWTKGHRRQWRARRCRSALRPLPAAR
jgi:hypothetical protein